MREGGSSFAPTFILSFVVLFGSVGNFTFDTFFAIAPAPFTAGILGIVSVICSIIIIIIIIYAEFLGEAEQSGDCMSGTLSRKGGR